MFTHALVPDVPLTPRLLRNVLMGHGRNFLGRAKIGQDFHYPLEYNWNRDAFVCISEGTLPISTESNFDCVLFGQLRSISARDGLLSLCCPDWTLFGWDAELGDLFDSQLSTLNDVTGLEHIRDITSKKCARVTDWVDGCVISVRVGPCVEYIMPSDFGGYGSAYRVEEDQPVPVSVGDTLVMAVTLYRTESEFSFYDHCREYTIVPKRVLSLRIACPLPSPTQSATLRSWASSDISCADEDLAAGSPEVPDPSNAVAVGSPGICNPTTAMPSTNILI